MPFRQFSLVLIALGWLGTAELLAQGNTSAAKAMAQQFEKFSEFKNSSTLKPDLNNKLGRMSAGNVNLDPVRPDDQIVLDEMAKYYVYPLTDFETYFDTPRDGAELVVKNSEAQSVAKTLRTIRDRLYVVTPGGNHPPTKVAFAREFGASIIKACDQILAMDPPVVVRTNILRVIGLVAESGAPAAWIKTTAILAQKDDKNLSLADLYYGLRAAENCLASYDSQRSLTDKSWTSREMYFNLVQVVDSIVNKLPAVVAEKTHIPDGKRAILTTANQPLPTELLPEQVAAIQAFRLQAVKALARVGDGVLQTEPKADAPSQTVYPILTLSRVAVSDPAIGPQPTPLELVEAIVGLSSMKLPETIDADMLSAVLARAALDLAAEKTADQRIIDNSDSPETALGTVPWKLSGARMEASFIAWEKVLQSPRTRINGDGKTILQELISTCNRDLFNPFAKGNRYSKETLDIFYNTRLKAIQAKTKPALMSDKTDLQFTVGVRK